MSEKKSKRIELTNSAIKELSKMAIDAGSCFKPFVEKYLEKLALKTKKK